MRRENALKGAIVGAGYTQKVFAKLLGISHKTLNTKLNRRGSFTMEEAETICKILGVTDAAKKSALFFRKVSQK